MGDDSPRAREYAMEEECRREATDCGYMAEIRIGVSVSFRGRALKVVGVSALGAEPRRVFLEDEDSGERFVITTRVLGVRELGGTPTTHLGGQPLNAA